MATPKQIQKRKETAFKILFAAPGTIIYSGIMVIPIFFSIYYSFLKWNGVGRKTFIGLKNYAALFTSNNYKIITQNTLTLVAVSFFITTTIALIVAYLIYRTKTGFKLFRGAIFMPVILSAIIIGLIFSILLHADMGPVNVFLKHIGLGKYAFAWLGDPRTALGAIIVPQVWQNIGYFTIIFLAGMQSIPKELTESAEIDGANSVIVFFKIVIPLIAEILQIIVILVVTYSLKSFGFSWIMTKGGPGVRSSFFTVYMFTKAFLESDFGTSSTISFNILVYAIVFTLAFKWFMKRMKLIQDN
ncbi:MAG: sugar ABC transporter permease [Treponema sp.]|jgi:raffinose/stachyose/melibiose transport system permease protein|nr:sugar ABC transporter permease [Treponema sp.]